VGPSGVVATLASLAAASIDAGTAHLTWLASAAAGVRFTIERRVDAGPWAPIGEAFSDGRGDVSFADPVPAGAASLGYRLSWTANGTHLTAGEVTLAVPRQARFALESLAPNPARDALTVRFALRANVPATLELIDVAGRRVRSEALETGAGGERVLRLDGLDALPAGMYLVRLSQGAGRAIARVALVR
ncbi:MAG: T9SS type A sorting domain-containing protein, partial [Candidatus Eisenbacteria bacterium]